MLFACTVLLSLFAAQASASPLGNIKSGWEILRRELYKRYDSRWQYGGPSSGGQTPYRTADQVRSDIEWPGGHPTRFVFWSELAPGQTDQVVYDWARQNDAIAIRDVLPDDYICKLSDDVGGEDNDDWFWNFVDTVSGAYADAVGQTTNGKRRPINSFREIRADFILAEVYIVTSNFDGVTRLGIDGTAQQGSVFYRVEAPTLRQYGLTQITYVNSQDFTQTAVRDLPPIPVGGPPVRQAQNGKRGTFVRRNDAGGTDIPITLNWDGYGDNPGENCGRANYSPNYSAGW